ncbi:hypothetical protein [Streptomyces koyangensis]|uniref:Uncharacterized protein n=1 Tax=Streptomyces koyangensis TaxID=188770 RepID=A0A385DCE5_9ACTN|nr:hypothetical protein [Streptomyces koyangensis]AXQ55650.1 hypothetical protein D0C37_14230 [Streptomyces koyangensis]
MSGEKAAPGRGFRVALSVGVAVVLVAVGLLFLVWAAVADRDAYQAAEPCGVRAEQECVRLTSATVRGTDDQAIGRGVRYWLRYTTGGRSSGEERVRMDGTSPVYDAVRAGDTVTLVHWQGEVASVRLGEAAQETHGSPARGWRMPLAVALVLLTPGAAFVWCALWYRRRASAPPRETVVFLPLTVLLSGVLLGPLSLFGALGGADVGEALRFTALCAPPVVLVSALTAWYFRRRSRRAADVSDIAPVTPQARQLLGAQVHGSVPYSREGYGLLVVGDGPLMATLDPHAKVARSPLPATLTVERIRAIEPSDPRGWLERYRYDGVVLVCRDGDEEVLIGTARRDAPLVWGALLAAGGGVPPGQRTASAG